MSAKGPFEQADRVEFWQFADHLLSAGTLVVERPRGSVHPRYRDSVYPLDYGYLTGSRSSDQAELDVWIGSGPRQGVQGVLCCVDLAKREAELKLLVGCSPDEIAAAAEFCNRAGMRSLLVRRTDTLREDECKSHSCSGV